MSGVQFLVSNAGVWEPFTDQHAFGARLDQLERIYRPDAFRDLVKCYRIRVLNKRDVIHRHRVHVKRGQGTGSIFRPSNREELFPDASVPDP